MQTSQFEEIIKIQPKGLITIPKKIRRELGLSDNSLARIKKVKGRVLIEPVRTLSYPVRTYSDKEIDEFIDIDNKESQELRKKGLL